MDFHGERRRNATHQSTTDPEARLCRKGKGRAAMLAYLGNPVMDNREGLAVAAQVHLATADGEVLGALELVEGLAHRAARITIGGDKAFDTSTPRAAAVGSMRGRRGMRAARSAR